jgi:hypothetical protein
MGKSIKSTNVSDNFFTLETICRHGSDCKQQRSSGSLLWRIHVYKQITKKADTVLQRFVKKFA